jgi:hypothetical protein
MVKLKYITFTIKWLGYQDSNLGMPRSKPGALPLGDTPTETLLKNPHKPVFLINGTEGET